VPDDDCGPLFEPHVDVLRVFLSKCDQRVRVADITRLDQAG
jgi:hypothetical protein